MLFPHFESQQYVVNKKGYLWLHIFFEMTLSSTDQVTTVGGYYLTGMTSVGSFVGEPSTRNRIYILPYHKFRSV